MAKTPNDLNMLDKHRSETIRNPRPTVKRSKHWLIAFFIVLACSARALWPEFNLVYQAGRPIAENDCKPKRPFSYSDIASSPNLQYYPCYDDLQCARLEVPMDYEDETASSKIALAVIRRPAKVSVTDSRYGGAVIINPGGPGGSGVAQQLSMGGSIQHIVDAEKTSNERLSADHYFDIISFDPRGVNNTTPTFSCFPDNGARQRWNLQVEAEGLLGSSTMSLRSNWRRARALADGCSRRTISDNSEKLAEHVNTSPIARDIVSIIERHGEWRENEATRLLAMDRALSSDCKVAAQKRTSWKKGKEPLLYWGFSYGTVIGSTFASMFPDRLARMVLDGVVDIDDYYSGSWTHNLADTDSIFSRFTLYCDKAGPEKCSFWRPGGPEAIQEAYVELLNAIWDDPLSVPGTEVLGPELITWTDIKLLVKDSLYSPLLYFPILADLMQDITNGNGSRFATYKQQFRKKLCQSSFVCDTPFSSRCVLPGWNPYDVLPAVLCTDALDTGDFSEDDFAAYWQLLRNQSRAMGDFWAQTRLSCAGWLAKAKRRFAGPFGGNTSHPILFIGNTLDTVTPLRNAKRMASLFEGAEVLQQDSEGHCSFTCPSVCTAKVVRHYFQTGDLPDRGTVCEPDARPFLGHQSTRKGESVEDLELVAVLEEGLAGFDSLLMKGM